MDDYRTTLLGRALADVLQEMEMEGTLEEAESDLLFELFDEAMLAEFTAAEPKEPKQKSAKRAATVTAPAAPPTPVLVQLYSHDRMELTGGVYAFNRYMDKWSLHACVDSDAMKLDGVPVDLTLPPSSSDRTELLVKLHDPRPTWSKRTKKG